MNKPIKFPKLSSVLDMSKQDLECLALDLTSELPEIDQFCALYKLKFLIEQRLNVIKENAIKGHLERFSGSTREGYNGFDVQIKTDKEWQFSDKVTEFEEKKKQIGKELTAIKNLEKADGTAKLISEKTTIALTMK